MSDQTEAAFNALGEPVRRRILELLRAGPTPVGELAGQLPVGRPAVSKHLRVLSDAGLIEHRSAGTRNLYALAPGGLAEVRQWLASTWDTALSAYAEEVRATVRQPDSEEKTMSLPPVRREIVVEAVPAVAFEVFTAGIGRWWPVATHSVHGAASSVAFDGGRIVEQSPGRAGETWGTVTRWDPPAAVAFTWHPGSAPAAATAVEVTFTAVDGGTLVVLEHSGWENRPDPAAARADYDRGWPDVLRRYRAAARPGGGARHDDLSAAASGQPG